MRRSEEQPPSEAGAWARLLRWFAARPRTERETLDRLARWGVDPDTAAGLRERLGRAGLLDDGAFAGAYARELAGKGFTGAALRARLEARGIDRALAMGAEALVRPEEEGRSALAVARRRRRALPADPAVALRRLTGYLERRGFSGARAAEAARRALAERDT